MVRAHREDAGMIDHAAFVDGFRRFWAAPSLDGFGALLADDVTLVQPLARTMRGLDEVRRGFRPVFAWLPDMRGEVDRWSASGDVLYVDFRLMATIGGRHFEWPVIDRFVLRADGKATERVSYFDSLPLLAATLGRPSGWGRLWSSGALTALARGRGGGRA
jgi:ketosteroid isomerase-like protein